MEVTFIRHTSVDVPPGVCYGQSDVPLRDSFEQEAAITSENLKAYRPQGRDFDHVYTSPLSRCVRLATYCGYPDAERDKRIMEINFGDWERKRVRTSFHLRTWWRTDLCTTLCRNHQTGRGIQCPDTLWRNHSTENLITPFRPCEDNQRSFMCIRLYLVNTSESMDKMRIDFMTNQSRFIFKA